MSINQIAPVALPPEEFIFSSDNTLKTNSVKVAEAFGKLHKNVLTKIESVECSEEFNRLNFKPVEYTDSKGEKRPAYEMTKDGFMFLVMGFTGKKAANVKEAYITAFNLMQEKLFLAAPTSTPAPEPASEDIKQLLKKKNIQLVDLDEYVVLDKVTFYGIQSVVSVCAKVDKVINKIA